MSRSVRSQTLPVDHAAKHGTAVPDCTLGERRLTPSLPSAARPGLSVPAGHDRGSVARTALVILER
jgi:hypothetical protein